MFALRLSKPLCTVKKELTFLQFPRRPIQGSQSKVGGLPQLREPMLRAD